MIQAIILLFYICIIIFDFLPLSRKSNPKVIWIYLSTLLLTFAVLILDSFHLMIPSLTKFIKFIIESIF